MISIRPTGTSTWVCLAGLLLLAADHAAHPGDGSDRTANAADPVVAPRPTAQRGMNLASLDRLLRMADVVVDPREDRGRRMRYAQALGATRSRYARPALIAVLNNDHDEAAVRRVAVVALAMIDDSCVVEPLIDLLADNDFQVAAAAQKSLQTITKRQGRMDRLPRDPDGPGRREIQDSWRVWWKQHRSRFERRVHHQLPVLQSDSTPRGPDRKPKAAVSSPVVVEFHVEHGQRALWVKQVL
jgi:HEAT repeats